MPVVPPKPVRRQKRVDVEHMEVNNNTEVKENRQTTVNIRKIAAGNKL